jgi:type VI protein secretion system component Hcp
MKEMFSVAVLTIACFIPAAPSTAADTTTLLIIPGIPGESHLVGYENAIDVYSITQSFAVGSKAAAACTVAVTKGIDRSGPLLWAAAVTGQTLPEVRVDILRAGDVPLRFYTLTLTNANVVSITSSPSTLTESLTLAGASATISYYPQRPDGSLGPPVTSTATCK